MRRGLALAASLLLAISPASGQQPAQPRTLEVSANASWQHADSGMILPSRSAGLARGEIRDNGEREMDVVAQYGSFSEEALATVYLFRTGAPYPALWFDRALTAILLRQEYGLDGTAAPVPQPFARPGAAVSSGLRASIALSAGDLRSTVIALVPLGDYLVKIRMSSTRLDPAQLDELLTRFVAGLRWPAPAAGERSAAAIQPCAEPLRLQSARIVQTGPSDVLMDALGSAVLANTRRDHPERAPPTYCREPGAKLEYGVYRPNASTSAYLIALYDAGLALGVGDALTIDGLGERGDGRRYAMSMMDRSSTSVLPSFNRLPPPEQALRTALGDDHPIVAASGNRPAIR